ncbi:MAG TPA: serine hydrolase domain-containing protein [Gemmatimonadaceae bacterium]|nr:serine hydrolase domain-containing protein [Gemmatimonadaceae bacterium]
MRCRSLLAAGLLAFAALAAPSAVAQRETTTDAQREAAIRDAMRDAGIPGLQTVVVKSGRIVWEKSFGYAVLAHPGPVRAMRNNSISFTASIGKILTAIAVMQQVEAGHIALDDDIDHSIPFVLRNPKWPDVPITWRMLLTHTSSVIDDDSVYERAYTYGRDDPSNLEQFIEGRANPSGDFHTPNRYLAARPGAARIYCNFCFDVMGYALARVTHESYDSYIERHVLVPLKMKETGSRLSAYPESVLAVGYGRTSAGSGKWNYSPNRESFGHLPASSTVLGNVYSSADPPAGAFYSSARDFARPLMMLLNRGLLDGVEILKPATVDSMLTFSGYYSVYGYRQGLSLFASRNLDDQVVWGHDGEDRGFITAVFFDRATGLGAICFANANRDDFLLSRRLVDLDMHLMDWFK